MGRSSITSTTNEEEVMVPTVQRRTSWPGAAKPDLSNGILLKRSESWSHGSSIDLEDRQTMHFNSIEKQFEAFPQEVRRVLKLCFSCLTVVFTEVDLTATKKKRKLSGGKNVCGIIHSRMPSIPIHAVSMLWAELLGVSESSDENSDRSQDRSAVPEVVRNESWKRFITEKEREVFLKVALSTSDDVCQYVKNQLCQIGLLQVIEADLVRREDSDNDSDITEDDSEESDDSDSGSEEESQRNDDETNASELINYDTDSTVESIISRKETLSKDAIKELAFEKRRVLQIKRSIVLKHRSEYIQIARDMHHQYGIYLSRLSRHEGGFSSNAYAKTVAYWNELMVIACLKKRRKLKVPRSFLAAAKKEGKNIIFNEWTSGNDPFYWISHKPNEQEMEDTIDDAVIYSLRVLPSHMMRARNIDDAVALLSSKAFPYARITILGITDGVRRHLHDCQELYFRVKRMANLDPNYAILSAFDAIKRCIVAEHPVKGLYIVGEQVEGEMGKALHNLAWNLDKMGLKDDALKYYVQALRYKKATPGPQDLNVANTLLRLGNLYLSKRMYSRGLKYYNKLLDIQETNLGVDHLKVADTLKRMAIVYGTIQDCGKAIAFTEKALSIEQKQLGDVNEESINTYNSLSRLYCMTGNYEKATLCRTQSLQLTIGIHGEDHPLVGKSYHVLGNIFQKTMDYPTAMSNYKSALIWRKTNLGRQHEEVAETLHEMGCCHTCMGEWEDAILCFDRTFSILKLYHDENHRKFASLYYDWGHALRRYERYNEAIKLLGQSSQIMKQECGEEHEEIGDVLYQMGLVFKDKGQPTIAIEYYKMALKLKMNYFGEIHLTVAEILQGTGDVLFSMDCYNQAVECYRKTYAIRRQLLGNDHIQVGEVCQKMGVLHLKKDEAAQALEFLKHALRIRKLKLGTLDPQVADTLHDMGLACKQMSDDEAAMGCYKEALKIREFVFGQKSLKVADTLYNIAIVEANMENLTFAKQCFEKIMEIYEEAEVKGDSADVVNVRQWISFLEGKTQKMPESEQ